MKVLVRYEFLEKQETKMLVEVSDILKSFNEFALSFYSKYLKSEEAHIARLEEMLHRKQQPPLGEKQKKFLEDSIIKIKIEMQNSEPPKMVWYMPETGKPRI